MTKLITARWLTLVGAIAALAMAAPAHAQFGVTFDPTQSAHAIVQIAQANQFNLTLVQQLTQDAQIASYAVKTYNQAITEYNTIVSNLKHFNSKTLWQTAENALMSVSVQNTYGETAGLQSQLNGQSQNSSAVWKIMNLAISGTAPSFWSSEIAGSSSRLSTLAHIEAMDAASSQCLAAAGAYQASRANNLQANEALDNSVDDTGDDTNSEVEQLNLLNQAESQHMEEAHAQGQLHACMAAQAAVANMDKRNEASVTINDANYKLTQQANNPTYLGNGSSTWTTYY